LSDLEVDQAREGQIYGQILLLVLTSISFITAVFGVFAVIYVTIYARRKEIGMMKAVGARNWELNGMLSVESIAMTLGAALAGIIAGSTMAYVITFVDNVTAQRPQQFTIDTTVMPFIIIVVTLAAVLGTILSARRIIKRKAVEILRMS
jgi:putative ABC transport system permease protein